ncbi:MAG: MoaD/ThiS family protein [Nanoarchaeota archaeon]
MQIKVFLERQNKHETLELERKSTVTEVMKQLKINSSEVITVRNNELVTEDASLKEGDELKFLAVISGG